MGTELLIALIASLGTAVSAAFAGIAIATNKKSEQNQYAKNRCEKVENWYEETLQILKDLCYLYNNNDEKNNHKDPQGKIMLLSKLSTSIDVGRGYFKNIIMDSTKGNKPDLFKGNRVVPIDLLVIYHHVFEQGKQKEYSIQLRNIERAFISEVTLYNEENEKKLKSTPYHLIDEAGILQIENLDNPKLKAIFTHEDIIKYVKLANEMCRKTPDEHPKENITEQSLEHYSQAPVKQKDIKKDLKAYFRNKEKNIAPKNIAETKKEDVSIKPEPQPER